MATKAELVGLPEALGRRIYRRWLDVTLRDPDDLTGAYDGCVENDDEVVLLVRSLSPDLISELAFGPMPEPRCTVCHSLNRPKNYNNTVVCAIMDYHDKTMRDAEPKRWKGGDEAYRRCMVIYTAAQEARDDTAG